MTRFFSTDYLREAKRRTWQRYVSRGAILFFIIAFLSYIGYQARFWVVAPPLDVREPADGSVLTGPQVLVQGTTYPGIQLTINGKKTYSDEKGFYKTELLLAGGAHTIEVVATNKVGRKRLVAHHVVVYQ